RLKVLYFFSEFGTLPLGGVATAAQRAGVARSVVPLAGAVGGVLWACRPAWRVPPIPARAAQRQSSEIDERDVGARSRSGHVPGVSALHQSCAVGCRARVAAVARRHSRSRGGR